MNLFNTNKSLISHLSLAATILASASFSLVSSANDITRLIRGDTAQVGTTENYLEQGVMHSRGSGPSLKNEKSWTESTLIFNGSYTWNDIFVESYNESGKGLSFGYHAFTNENWALDLKATTEWGQYNFENNGRYASLNNHGYSEPFTIGARLTGALGEYIVQFEVAQDATGDHNGTTASALLGRNWQVDDWNFHTIVGVEYASAKLNDFYVGISQDRADASPLEAFEANASLNFSSEVGVTYPVSDDWEFRATVRAATISDEITDSPYFSNKDSVATSFRTSLSYEF